MWVSDVGLSDMGAICVAVTSTVNATQGASTARFIDIVICIVNRAAYIETVWHSNALVVPVVYTGLGSLLSNACPLTKQSGTCRNKKKRASASI